MIFSVLSLILIVSRTGSSLAQESASKPDDYFADCLTSWEFLKNSSYPGSNPQPNIPTVDACLESCSLLADCSAVEVDYNDDTVLCSHHNLTEYTGTGSNTSGIVHYRRRRRCVQIVVDPNAAAAGGMLDFLNQMEGSTDRKVPTCNDLVDLAFAVDVSPSVEEFGVNAGYFNLYVKVFLVNYVRYLNIGLDKIRVGMVTFDDTARQIFPLSSNATEITELINRVNYGSPEEEGEDEYGGGAWWMKQKHISSGLELLKNHVLSPGAPGYRADAVHVAVLITDGRSTASDRGATMTAATDLKKRGVFVQIIGVTSKVDLFELRRLGSPVPDLVTGETPAITVNDTYGFLGAVSYFQTVEYLSQGLDELMDQQANTVCPRQRPPIVCNDYADVVLVIDMSSYIQTRSQFPNYFSRFLHDFLLRFVRLLNIRSGRIQVAAVTYANSAQLVFTLTSNFTGVYKKLNGLAYTSPNETGKNLSHALYLVKTHVLNVDAFNYRHDSLNLIVVFGDGDVTNATPSALSHAHELQEHGALFVTVPVTPGDGQDELEAMASREDELNRGNASESVKSGFIEMSPGAVVPSEVEVATVVNKIIRIQSQVLCPDRSTPESACLYELDHGISCALEGSTRWFYRKATDSCSTFDYNGCGGNPNSFSERELCERTCIKSDICQSQPCPTGKECVKLLQDGDYYSTVCIAKADPYPCPAMNCTLNCTYGRSRDGDDCELCRCSHPCDTVTCSATSICTVGTIYSNDVPPNVIGYVGECVFTEGDKLHEPASVNSLSRPDDPTLSKPDPLGCKLDLDIGFRCVTAPVVRWYFKEILNVCSQFDFQGCGGNKNNFENRETCDVTCRMSYKEQCKAHACAEGLECELIDMSLLCPVETPCPGSTAIRCVAPIRPQKRYCSFHSGLSPDFALAVADISRQVKFVVVRQMPAPTDNPESQFLWYEDSVGGLRSKSEQCISDGIPMQLVKCDAAPIKWFFDTALNVIRTEKDANQRVKAIAVSEQLAESDQKISIPKHLVATEDYLRSIGQQTHEATWTIECV